MTSDSTSADSSCPSDLVLDRRLAGELDPQEAARLEAHLAGCAGCRQRLERLERLAESYRAGTDLAGEAARTLARLHQEAESRPRRSRVAAWLAGVAAAAAAAALALALLLPAGPPPTEKAAHGTRLKGGFALGAFLKRGEEVERARSGQVFHPGDALRFTCTARRAGHLALVAVDAKRVVTLYHPSSAGPAASVPAGVGQPLPGSTILDETLGPETVVGVLCAESFDTKTLVRRGRELVDAVRAGRDPARWLPGAGGCQVARFDLDKRTRPPGDAR
jgi:hypothetical protein